MSLPTEYKSLSLPTKYTSFQSAFATLIETWTNSMTSTDCVAQFAGLSRGPSLIVAQYTGTAVTVHYCDLTCDCYGIGLRCVNPGLICMGMYDDGICGCTKKTKKNATIVTSLPNQLVESLQTDNMSIIDLTADTNMQDISDYLVDYLLDHVAQMLIKQTVIRQYYYTLSNYIAIVQQYHDKIVKALFTRRNNKLAEIIKVPSKYMEIWNSCKSIEEYDDRMKYPVSQWAIRW
ncbi:MAG: hypothetical protein Faunusvirus8_23 [Faunusvirus sp.]|jgi:hypothetical protein|uniref:Uncharacterized protein n=1 Tax=Faunusvirus sp. TaxID=2487766 RepID=A0A3G4ZWM7_9VIRU|nr:MAG: hypothetical protein Faunusvirus8_23 [Faunusvirus sp.]